MKGAHRNNPIFHALIPGEAEHKTLMGLPRAPTIKAAVNEVCECLDVHMTEGGCGWLAAVIKIKKSKPEDPFNAIQAALAGHRSMKMVTIVDRRYGHYRPSSCRMGNGYSLATGCGYCNLSNQKGSSLDPSRNEDTTTSKVGFDATISLDKNPDDFHSVM